MPGNWFVSGRWVCLIGSCVRCVNVSRGGIVEPLGSVLSCGGHVNLGVAALSSR